MHKECGATLLKEVTAKDSTTRLYAHKIYCYQSVVATLEKFVQRSGFTEQCELWRNRDIRTVHHVMWNVFEGRIWGGFQMVNGCLCLGSPRNYGFMLNVDWMQPFDHTP